MSSSDRRRHQQRRPTTIAELSERALDNLYDESKPLKHYLRVAERYRKDARDYYSKGDLENAFILFARAATLVLDKLPTHREFYTLLNLTQRNNLHLNGTDILEDLGDLKRKLTKRSEDWVRDHPEEELKTLTSVSTSGANDVDLGMRRTRSKGKERERGRHSNQRRIQEEYSLWRQDDYDHEDIDELADRERRRNRERDPTRDRGVFVVPQPSPHDGEAKKEAAVAAREAASASQTIPALDYTFSRPPLQSQNGYPNIARGTPVPGGNEEGRRYMESERQYLYEQQQKAMRHREEEILRKREDQRRTREQEDILRRQKEVEDATQTARPASRTLDNSGTRVGGLTAQGSVASISSVPSPAPATVFQQSAGPASSFYQAPPAASTPFYAPVQGSSSTSVFQMAPPSYPTPGSSLTTVVYTNTRNPSPTRPPAVATIPGPDHPRMEISQAPSQAHQITLPQPHAPLAPSQTPPLPRPPLRDPPTRPPSRDPPPVASTRPPSRDPPPARPPSFVEGGPTLLPIQPARLEGDSTDTESVYSTNLRRDENQRSYPEHPQTRARPELQRTPTRSKIRSPSPVTTTSPPPPEVGRGILYPQLMSQHQKNQGYYPSSNSMFSFSEAPRIMYQTINNDPRQQYPNSASSAPLYGSAPEFLYGQQKYQQGSTPHPYRPTQQPSPSSSSSSSSQPRLIFPGLPQPVTAVPLPTPPIYASVPNTADRFVPRHLPQPPSSSRSQLPSYPRQARGLKTVTLPKEVLPRFLAIAKVNTAMNRETCGLLLGKDKSSKYAVTTLLIPRQHSTSDTCAMDEEELVLQFTEERSLITLGWIHTHPSQSCFMSSVDLHTHSGFQRMLPESFAVVCAPKSTPNYGIFRLTDPLGLKTILDCHEKDAFHPHPDVPIYTDADKGHVQIKEGAPLEIVDLR